MDNLFLFLKNNHSAGENLWRFDVAGFLGVDRPPPHLRGGEYSLGVLPSKLVQASHSLL